MRSAGELRALQEGDGSDRAGASDPEPQIHPEPGQVAIELQACRICYADDLYQVLDLGSQALSGVFPKPEETVPEGKLTLVECGKCEHVQLGHTYERELLYGPTYGYRSGLNEMMVKHLKRLAFYANTEFDLLEAGDIVLDIGSNDGTLLRHFPPRLQRVGMDPLANKFADHYDKDIHRIPDFFSARKFQEKLGAKAKAKVVTTIACFYDMPEPLNFIAEVLEILADDGIWISEQSYLPAMCEAHSFDTICHEHLAYYRLADFERMAEFMGLRIADAVLTDSNGGSFVVAMTRANLHGGMTDRVPVIRNNENAWEEYDGLERFARWTEAFPQKIYDLMYVLHGKVYGYGASTKGNVLLNYCNFDRDFLPCIADRNPEKWGRVTPGSEIPIVSEEVARMAEPDFLFVLPWHFRDGIVKREKKFLDRGGILVFPLPEIGFEI